MNDSIKIGTNTLLCSQRTPSRDINQKTKALQKNVLDMRPIRCSNTSRKLEGVSRMFFSNNDDKRTWDEKLLAQRWRLTIKTEKNNWTVVHYFIQLMIQWHESTTEKSWIEQRTQKANLQVYEYRFGFIGDGVRCKRRRRNIVSFHTYVTEVAGWLGAKNFTQNHRLMCVCAGKESSNNWKSCRPNNWTCWQTPNEKEDWSWWRLYWSFL